MGEDLTQEFLLKEEEVEEQQEEKKEEKGDHPVITILDMAFNQAEEFCKKQNLPPPNKTVYEGFSKPFLNKALWHYLPDGNLPDDPKVALVIGVGGLALAFLPTAKAIIDKKKEKKEKKEEKREEGKKEEAKADNSMIANTGNIDVTFDAEKFYSGRT